MASRLRLRFDMKRRASRDSGTAITVVSEGTACETSPALTVPASGIDLEALERAVIAFALEHEGGNQVQSARFLGLSRSALIYRMQKYGLTAGKRRRAPAASAQASRATGDSR
jgi:DNA-binding NtrC family response regulator